MVKLTVAFQGEPGAFSEEAAVRFFGTDAVLLPCPTLREAFTAVVTGVAERAVVPVENSHTGSIMEAYDLLLEMRLAIVGEVALAVDHCLLALPGTTMAEVRRVHSHPQALAQCDGFLRRHGYEPAAAADTAGSARLLGEQRPAAAAAIAPRRAATIYGLEVLASSIQDNPDNTTRFQVVAPPKTAAPADADKTSLVLALREDNAPGALFWCLATLAYWQVNLLKIESRPTRHRNWHYLFHLDLDAAATAPACSAALAELSPKATLLRVLGSYRRAVLPVPGTGQSPAAGA